MKLLSNGLKIFLMGAFLAVSVSARAASTDSQRYVWLTSAPYACGAYQCAYSGLWDLAAKTWLAGRGSYHYVTATPFVVTYPTYYAGARLPYHAYPGYAGHGFSSGYSSYGGGDPGGTISSGITYGTSSGGTASGYTSVEHSEGGLYYGTSTSTGAHESFTPTHPEEVGGNP